MTSTQVFICTEFPTFHIQNFSNIFVPTLIPQRHKAEDTAARSALLCTDIHDLCFLLTENSRILAAA